MPVRRSHRGRNVYYISGQIGTERGIDAPKRPMSYIYNSGQECNTRGGSDMKIKRFYILRPEMYYYSCYTVVIYIAFLSEGRLHIALGALFCLGKKGKKKTDATATISSNNARERLLLPSSIAVQKQYRLPRKKADSKKYLPV